MNERKLVIAAAVWTMGILFASYLYRAIVTDARYNAPVFEAPNATARIIQPS